MDFCHFREIARLRQSMEADLDLEKDRLVERFERELGEAQRYFEFGSLLDLK